MTEKSRAGLAFVIVTLFLDVLGIGLMIPILPQLVTDFRGGSISAGSSSFGYVIALYTMMLFLFSPVQGALSDQYGRKPVLFLSLTGTALSYFLLAYAESLPWVYAAEIVNGITGASITVCSAYIADVTPPAERSKNFGLIGATFGIGLIVGPALGGLLGNVGLRVPFVVAGGLSLLNLVYGFLVLPESLDPAHRHPFTWARANPAASMRMLVRTRRLVGLSALLLFTNLGLQCLRSTWVLYNTYRFNWTPNDNGWSLAAAGVLSAGVQAGAMRVSINRLGEYATIALALVSGTISYVIFGCASAGWMMYLGLLFNAPCNAAVPAAQGLASNEVGPTEQGQMQGAIAALTTICASIGTLVATFVFSYFTSADAPAQLPGAAYFLGALLFLLALAMTLATRREV